MLIGEGVAVQHLLRGIFAIATNVIDLLGRNVENRRRIVCSIQQRARTILIAVEHRQQRVGVVGVVAVHRGVGHRTNGHRGIGAVTEHNDRNGQRNGIEQHLALFVCEPHRCTQRSKHRKDEEYHTRIDGQTQRIDEQAIHCCTDGNRIRNDYTIDSQQNSSRHAGCRHDTFERYGRPLAEVVDEYQRRDCQQVQDMHTDRQTHQVCDQNQPTVCVRIIGHVLPFEHCPHNQRGEHRRESIDLTLDSREPEGVGEGVSQCAHSARTQNCPHRAIGQRATACGIDTTCEMGDCPEEEQNAETAGNRRHHIDHCSQRSGRGCKQHKQTRQHHKERRSGRVSHFEFV